MPAAAPAPALMRATTPLMIHRLFIDRLFIAKLLCRERQA
jgi:hypothetical protein